MSFVVFDGVVWSKWVDFNYIIRSMTATVFAIVPLGSKLAVMFETIAPCNAFPKMCYMDPETYARTDYVDMNIITRHVFSV